VAELHQAQLVQALGIVQGAARGRFRRPLGGFQVADAGQGPGIVGPVQAVFRTQLDQPREHGQGVVRPALLLQAERQQHQNVGLVRDLLQRRTAALLRKRRFACAQGGDDGSDQAVIIHVVESSGRYGPRCRQSAATGTTSKAIVRRLSSGPPENGTVPCHMYEGNNTSKPGSGLTTYSGSSGGRVGNDDSPNWIQPSPGRSASAGGKCR